MKLIFTLFMMGAMTLESFIYYYFINENEKKCVYHHFLYYLLYINIIVSHTIYIYEENIHMKIYI